MAWEDDAEKIFKLQETIRMDHRRTDDDCWSTRRLGSRTPSPHRTPSPQSDPEGSRSRCVPPSRVPAAPSSSSGEPTQVSHSGSSWQSPGWLPIGTPFTTPEIPPGTTCPCGNFARGKKDGLCNACWWQREREAKVPRGTVKPANAKAAAPSSNTARTKFRNKKRGNT